MAVKRVILFLSLALFASSAFAQSGPGPNIRDVCLYAAKSSVPISISGSQTINLVAPNGAASIYVCGINVTFSRAPFNSLLFSYSSSSSCASPAPLTGTLGLNIGDPGSVTPLAAGYAGTIFIAPSGTALCATTTGGAQASVQGVLTFVEQ